MEIARMQDPGLQGLEREGDRTVSGTKADGSQGFASCETLSPIPGTPQMHIPLWFWFSSLPFCVRNDRRINRGVELGIFMTCCILRPGLLVYAL